MKVRGPIRLSNNRRDFRNLEGEGKVHRENIRGYLGKDYDQGLDGWRRPLACANRQNSSTLSTLRIQPASPRFSLYWTWRIFPVGLAPGPEPE